MEREEYDGNVYTLNTKPLNIDFAYQDEFTLEIARFNLQRGKLLTSIIIGIELVLLMIELFYHPKNTGFEYGRYTFMYLLMIAVSGGVWLAFSYLEKNADQKAFFIKAMQVTSLSYITFLMVWGAVISLFDQSLYGNIVVFMVNILFASYMFYIKSTSILIPQLIAAGVLLIGLPNFQPSPAILMGHWINTGIFVLFAWVMARANYTSYLQNFINRKLVEEKTVLLAQTNAELVKEIQSREETQKELEAANEQLTIIATLDALTGIPNRRRLDQSLQEHWSMAVKEQLPFTILMIDIDFFKLYNDTNGHLAGDRCLQAVAGVLDGCRKEPTDFVARFGGEEFLFVATGILQAETRLLAEKIRHEIEGLKIAHNVSQVSPYITASIGISWQLPSSTNKLSESLEQADKALYQAKEEGRNRVVMAG